ncbi:MAG: HlyD family efflux transporter periplasmic adaptor subunit, partial [Pirellulaceae bacterium]
PVLVTALAEGVVGELLVVDGQMVEAGQPVAKLIDVDARLALNQAEADLALRQAELASIRAEWDAAKLRLQHPSHLEAPLADAESSLAKVETELGQLPLLVQAARARVEYAKQDLEGKRSAGSAVAGRARQRAQSAYDVAVAELEELKERRPRLKSEAEALQRKREALAEQCELLIEESRSVADSEAKLQVAEARCRQAELAVEKAELELDRMVVKTPVAGRVLELIARPGSRVAGARSGSTGADSAVVSLYDPKMLQVRADVRLEDVPLVQPGQPVRIETASSKEPIDAEVLYATSTANVQKNTLEVKVALRSPPDSVRPEMLATATFLAPDQGGSESEEDRRRKRLLVPRQLVESSGDGHPPEEHAGGQGGPPLTPGLRPSGNARNRHVSRAGSGGKRVRGGSAAEASARAAATGGLFRRRPRRLDGGRRRCGATKARPSGPSRHGSPRGSG